MVLTEQKGLMGEMVVWVAQGMALSLNPDPGCCSDGTDCLMIPVTHHVIHHHRHAWPQSLTSRWR
jgi:hypothetical protein